MTPATDFYGKKALGELYAIALRWANGDKDRARLLLNAYLAGQEGFKP